MDHTLGMHVHQAPTELPVDAPKLVLSNVVGGLVALQVLNQHGVNGEKLQWTDPQI